jgi:hypothetical protein
MTLIKYISTEEHVVHFSEDIVLRRERAPKSSLQYHVMIDFVFRIGHDGLLTPVNGRSYDTMELMLK